MTVLLAPPGATSTSLGIFLLTLTAMMLVLSAAAMRSKPLFGVPLVVFSIYGALALLLEDDAQRTVLPLG